MAITRAQQAKQLLAQGGRTGFFLGGGGGADYDIGGGGNPNRTSTTSSTNREKGIMSRGGGEGGTTKSIKDFKETGPDRSAVDTGSKYKKNVNLIKEFERKRPIVKTPPLGVLSFFKKPLQKFSDFTTARNRKFFQDVIRAGKIPGLNYQDISNLTSDELEDKYQDYMANRLAGKTDAYGNPMAGFSYDSQGNLVGSFRDDGPDPIPFIPPVEDDTGEDDVAEYVNPLSLLTPRIAGTQFAANGGRIGFNMGGAQFTSGGNISPGTDVRGNVRDDNPFTGGGGDGPKGPPSVISPPPKEKFPVKKKLRTGIENAVRTAAEINYLRNLYKLDPVGLGLSFVGNKISDFLFPPAGAAELSEDELNIQKAINQKGYDDTIKEVLSDKTAAGGAITDVVPDLGNPEVLNKIAIDAGLPTEKKGVIGLRKDVATPESASAIKNIQNLKRNPDLEFKADEIIELGSPSLKNLSDQQIQDVYDMVSLPGQNRFTAAGGGIANLDREAFLLGGIAKGLKKAVRGVKKLAKSPIGKAALLASPFLLKKGLFSSLIGQKAMTQAPFAKGTGILGFLQANPMESIFAASALAGLMTSKQDDDKFDLASYYAQNQLEPSQSIRGMGSEFDFYGGQRMRVADGGDVEPVAKKTMPLLDMDGKEKDYRETGGFVDMGRMERADDVPARLSKNEFVFTADAVRNAGEGDIDKGAEVMYNMMKNLEAGGEVSEESQGLEGARKMFQTSQRLGEVI